MTHYNPHLYMKLKIKFIIFSKMAYRTKSVNMCPIAFIFNLIHYTHKCIATQVIFPWIVIFSVCSQQIYEEEEEEEEDILCLTKHHAMKTYGGVELYIHAFLTLESYIDESGVILARILNLGIIYIYIYIVMYQSLLCVNLFYEVFKSRLFTSNKVGFIWSR
jgi:hypothetical protein